MVALPFLARHTHSPVQSTFYRPSVSPPSISHVQSGCPDCTLTPTGPLPSCPRVSHLKVRGTTQITLLPPSPRRWHQEPSRSRHRANLWDRLCLAGHLLQLATSALPLTKPGSFLNAQPSQGQQAPVPSLMDSAHCHSLADRSTLP